MSTKRKLRSLFWTAGIALVLLSSITSAASAERADNTVSALAGGQVLPPGDEPQGYSLTDAAKLTAKFNTRSIRTPDTLPDDFPFQILYITPDGSNTFSVTADTMFYVPVVQSDNTDSALWPFPDVTDPAAVSDYYFDPAQLGAEFIRIVVDGQVTDLGPEYAVGTKTPRLNTGAKYYTVVAAFLTPLSQGHHTVTIAARFSGAFIAMYPDFFPGGVYEFEFRYTVIVE